MSGVTLRFDSSEVSDAEVAAVTVAVAAIAGASQGAADDAGAATSTSAWRAAALLEATDGRRLGSRAALRQARSS